MALELHIPPCVNTPAGPLHPPPPGKPVRVQIEGPLVSIQKLLPGIAWRTEDVKALVFPQPAGMELARLAHRTLYPEMAGDCMVVVVVVRDEYLGWVMGTTPPLTQIDYYGVTFDHLVPADDPDPEVLQLNIIEMDDDGGAYANEHLLFAVDPAEYTGKKVLAVPRCCQKRKGTQDRARVNGSVLERDEEEEGMLERRRKRMKDGLSTSAHDSSVE
ncbi:hypothetical protein GGS20DRAFT_337979 [Poronia punctata]|nr:hypothetical protein GGS20DRAFT_337979 [Poronia punctata]